jgi:hypothetical protein
MSIATDFARCRSLAVAAMIQAGGKPCWISLGVTPAALPAPRSGATLSAREREKLSGFSAAGLTVVERALARVSVGPTPEALATVAGRKAATLLGRGGGGGPQAQAARR